METNAKKMQNILRGGVDTNKITVYYIDGVSYTTIMTSEVAMRKTITSEDRKLIKMVSWRRKAGMKWRTIASDINWAQKAKRLGLCDDWTGLYNHLYRRTKHTRDGDLVPIHDNK